MMGYATVASDGEAGTVCDLLFDDATWRVRWLVVNTRRWLPRHEVLLAISVLGRPDPVRRRLPVRLTMRQVEDGPAAEQDLPVSRAAGKRGADDHLRSVEAVVGHRVRLRDDMVGHVEELVVDDADWSIRHIRVDICKWRPGDTVLLAPRLVREIDWYGRLVRFDVGRRDVEGHRGRQDVIWMRSRNDAGTNIDTGAPDQAQAGLSSGRGGGRPAGAG
jgi:hypothetical protein